MNDEQRLRLTDGEITFNTTVPKLFQTSEPLKFKVSGPSRQLEFRAGPEGPTLCPFCGIYAVTDGYQQSTFPSEPAEKLIGKKCHWCGGWPDKAKVESSDCKETKE